MKLGTGTLTWDRGERVSDRYGAVYLIPDGHNSLTAGYSPSVLDAEACSTILGKRGRLVAIVKTVRDSTHIGDMFHGITPRRPEVGQKIVLGSGTPRLGLNYEGEIQIELVPEDGRDTLWMDIRALYDAHEQTVDLMFEPAS